MDLLPALKQVESQLSIVCDRLSSLRVKLEDLLFRAQRIAAAQKNLTGNHDMMFGYDIQHFRRDIRAFAGELNSLPTVLGSIERAASHDEKASKLAQAVMRLSMRLSQSLRALHDMSVLAHQHIRAADHKIEAWYLAQEIENMVMRGQGLPTAANRIVVLTSNRPIGSAPTDVPPAKA